MSQNPDENPLDPKFEFWNELPNEMRSECIKRMDFKTRMQLRATSKQDKSLVESVPKYHFEKVIVELDVEYMPNVICKKSECSEVTIEQERGETLRRKTPAFLEKAHQLVIQVLKFAKTENLEFASKFATDADVSKFLADISNSPPFHFKSITLDCGKFEVIDFFLKNCNSLELIGLERCDNEIDEAKMIEFINFSTVINAKKVLLVDLKAAEIPYQLITKWFEKEDLELGKTLQISLESANFIDFLAEKFENRVVSKIAETLRIRTDDSAKHVLIRSIPDKEGYYSFLVIPSDQKESEYEKNDQWAREHSRKQIWKRMIQMNLRLKSKMLSLNSKIMSRIRTTKDF